MVFSDFNSEKGQSQEFKKIYTLGLSSNLNVYIE